MPQISNDRTASPVRRPRKNLPVITGRIAVAKKPKPRPMVTARKAKPRPSGVRPAIPPTPTIRKQPLTPAKPLTLAEQAAQQIDAELSGQISPLESQRTSTQTRETSAASEIDKMFGGLQPYVNDAAHLVSDSYDKSNAAETAIFAAAGKRLNDTKQAAAAEAQNLAQEMGGPVAVSDFTDAVDPSIGAFGAEQAGALLHGLGNAQAGTQEAADWAGRVFPLLRTQKQAESRSGYETQIKEIEDHITQLKGTRAGAINTRFNELQTADQNHQLQVAQQKLEQLKANRDWQATVHTLKNDDKRLALAGNQFGLDKAGVTGKYDGKPTLAARKLTADQKLAAQQMNLSNQQFLAKLTVSEESNAIARQRVNNQAKKNSMQMIDALLQPTSEKPITLTTKHYVPKNSPEASGVQLGAITGKRKDAHWDPKKKQWYFYQKETLPSSEWAQRNTGGTPITSAKSIYGFLLNQGIPAALARTLVKTRTGTDPTPGKKGK